LFQCITNGAVISTDGFQSTNSGYVSDSGSDANSSIISFQELKKKPEITIQSDSLGRVQDKNCCQLAVEGGYKTSTVVSWQSSVCLLMSLFGGTRQELFSVGSLVSVC
jgi:hypothetical protein